jgi:hypothetical protein
VHRRSFFASAVALFRNLNSAKECTSDANDSEDETGRKRLDVPVPPGDGLTRVARGRILGWFRLRG